MPKSKKWYLREISDLGVMVLRDGQELKDRRGEALGPIKNIRRPYTRKTCEHVTFTGANLFLSKLQSVSW